MVSQLPLPALPEPFRLGSQINCAAEARTIPRVKQHTPKREMAAILRKDTDSTANRAVSRRGVVSFIFVNFKFVGCDQVENRTTRSPLCFKRNASSKANCCPTNTSI